MWAQRYNTRVWLLISTGKIHFLAKNWLDPKAWSSSNHRHSFTILTASYHFDTKNYAPMLLSKKGWLGWRNYVGYSLRLYLAYTHDDDGDFYHVRLGYPRRQNSQRWRCKYLRVSSNHSCMHGQLHCIQLNDRLRRARQTESNPQPPWDMAHHFNRFLHFSNRSIYGYHLSQNEHKIQLRCVPWI